jgi:selenium-binding protein 1
MISLQFEADEVCAAAAAGDLCMYDISNPAEPKFADRVWLGGSIVAGGPVTVSRDALATLGLTEQPEAPVIKGVKVQGGPQMLQLR